VKVGVTCWSADRGKLQLIKELGCDEFYSTVEWCNIHKAPDMYNWSQLDSEFRLEQEFGLKSVRVIMHTPTWASGVDPSDCKFRPTSYPPRTLEYYSRFCAALVRRYPGRTWILWGEADNNFPREDPKVIQWAGDTETYVKMAKCAYIEMKKADSKCVVGLSSLVGATLNGEFPTIVENGQPLSKLHVFDKMLELGMGDCCNFVPIDLYCYGYGNSKNFLVGIRKIKEIMAKYHVRKPLYITETGAKITPSGSKMMQTFHHEAVSEETQAGFLMHAYEWAKQAGIQKMFWHTLRSSEWGLVNRLGNKHLSWYAFRAILAGVMEN